MHPKGNRKPGSWPHSFVAVVQIPAWCNGEMPNPCGDFDGSAYALSRLPYIHPWLSLVIEVWTIHIKPYN
jgi:hypothetical protein